MTAQEATNLYRTLAEHNPAAHTPDLAMSLNNLANRLDSNGQQREALKTAQEAVTIRRNLAEHNPAAHTQSHQLPQNLRKHPGTEWQH